LQHAKLGDAVGRNPGKLLARYGSSMCWKWR